MPRRRPGSAYRLSPAAQSDLSDIWDYTAETWSVDQAEAYLRGLTETIELLCEHPEIARERNEFNPPVRLHSYRSHLIIYRIEEGRIVVVRVVHSRQHWKALLDE